MSNVFAFEWCDCIFESGFSLVSLHDTKRGALKAMLATANRRWQGGRNDQLMYGGCGKERFDPLEHKAWRVRAIELSSFTPYRTNSFSTRQAVTTSSARRASSSSCRLASARSRSL